MNAVILKKKKRKQSLKKRTLKGNFFSLSPKLQNLLPKRKFQSDRKKGGNSKSKHVSKSVSNCDDAAVSTLTSVIQVKMKPNGNLQIEERKRKESLSFASQQNVYE